MRTALVAAAARMLPPVQCALCVAPPQTLDPQETLVGSPAGRAAALWSESASGEGLDPMDPSRVSTDPHHPRGLPLVAGLGGAEEAWAAQRPALMTRAGLGSGSGVGHPPLLSGALAAAQLGSQAAGTVTAGAPGAGSRDRGDHMGGTGHGDAGEAAPLLVAGGQGNRAPAQGLQWGAWRAASAAQVQSLDRRGLATIVRQPCWATCSCILIPGNALTTCLARTQALLYRTLSQVA